LGFKPSILGLGLGGHCIPIDPFYLSWKAHEYDFSTRFIDLAGEINTNMPHEVVTRVVDCLNVRGIPSRAAHLLVLGLAYKKNVDDCRESPSIKILRLLAERGFILSYFDPHVSGYISHRYGRLPGIELPELRDDVFLNTDASLILTDHDAFDYNRIVRLSKTVFDTRNATKNVSIDREKIILT
jgi:UDP-N-acetyl-D-glucosamine dehydrogenase